MSRARRFYRTSQPMRRSSLMCGLREDLEGSTEEQIRALVLKLRRRGACIAEIADRVYPEVISAQSRIHQILGTAPRRLRFGHDVVVPPGTPVGIGGEP